jgi:hypothetical protein
VSTQTMIEWAGATVTPPMLRDLLARVAETLQ